MKQAILIIIAIATTFTSYGQAFSSVSIAHKNSEQLIFSTPKEINVRHYRIEAANNENDFEVIGRVDATGNNAMRGVQYAYNLAGQHYTHYRVVQVNMNGSMPASAIVSREVEQEEEYQPIIEPGHPLANR